MNKKYVLSEEYKKDYVTIIKLLVDSKTISRKLDDDSLIPIIFQALWQRRLKYESKEAEEMFKELMGTL